MKIFMTGSIIGHKPGTGQMPRKEDKPLLKAAEEIGYEAAFFGHEILLRNIESYNVIDRYILQGIIKLCSDDSSKRAIVELHLPEFCLLNQVSYHPSINIKIFRHPGHGVQYYPDNYFEFLTSTVRAIECCDIAITLGDGESVRMIGSLAALENLPVAAIASFGGSSKEVFSRNWNAYSSIFTDSHIYSVLFEKWSKGSAKKIIQLAEMLNTFKNKKHTYFMSYSHKDDIIADQVELLLRRKNRHVLRDEINLKVGEQVPDRIVALIGECDTFLVIGSKNYITSEWCKRELTFAIDNIGPGRIAYLDTDGSGFPIQVSNKLGITARSREARSSAIERLISEEVQDRSDASEGPKMRLS